MRNRLHVLSTGSLLALSLLLIIAAPVSPSAVSLARAKQLVGSYTGDRCQHQVPLVTQPNCAALPNTNCSVLATYVLCIVTDPPPNPPGLYCDDLAKDAACQEDGCQHETSQSCDPQPGE